MRVIRNTGDQVNTECYPLSEAGEIVLQMGDDLSFTADKCPGTIAVRVEGGHLSAQGYVLPHCELRPVDRLRKEHIKLVCTR